MNVSFQQSVLRSVALRLDEFVVVNNITYTEENTSAALWHFIRSDAFRNF